MKRQLPRNVLPIPDVPHAGPTMYDIRDPDAKYRPTCQALLTGRNHHSVGMGTVAGMATAAPGYTSIRPNTAATIAEMLRLNGYSTAQFGKCHEVPTWESSPAGPFDRWPTGNGFEYFYGFIGGETNQFYPTLIEGTNSVQTDMSPRQGYHLSEDLAQRARRWLGQQRAMMPDKPFFLYFAPGATMRRSTFRKAGANAIAASSAGDGMRFGNPSKLNVLRPFIHRDIPISVTLIVTGDCRPGHSGEIFSILYQEFKGIATVPLMS